MHARILAMDSEKRAATYEDLLALPPHVTGQIVAGVLYAFPRPAPRHAISASALGVKIGGPFHFDEGGPGGWVILAEPELHFTDDVLVPDLAGWRRERMPVIPVDRAYFDLAPDWVCEVLSPSTSALDRGDKLTVYAREKVTHVWFVDPDAQTLEVLALDLDKGRYVVESVFSGAASVRARPFDAIALDLAVLWQR